MNRTNELFKKLRQEFKESFAEDFLMGTKVKGEYYEVFINPTSNEMRAIGNWKRFAIDMRRGKKTVYVWGSTLLHKDAARLLNLPYPHNDIIYGEKNTTSVNSYTLNIEFETWVKADYPEEIEPIRKRFKRILKGVFDNKWFDLTNVKREIEKFMDKYDFEEFE